MQGLFPPELWGGLERRLMIGLDKILTLLSKASLRATFFISGWLAEDNRKAVILIDKAGHEIASHGFRHDSIYKQTPEEFQKDVRMSLDVLQGITGKKVLGFRAPNYSISAKTLWALEILKSEGIKYDSSIYPGRRFTANFGILAASRPFFIKQGLLEVPLSALDILHVFLPVGSGIFFRLYPYSVTKYGISRLNRKGVPAVVNIHPWELDPGQPKQKIGIFKKMRHYANLDKTEEKLIRLLEDFEFSAMYDLFGEAGLKG